MSQPVSKRVHPALVVLAVAGCLHLFYVIGVELDRNLVHRRDVARLEAEVSALATELARLDEVAAHGADRAYRDSSSSTTSTLYAGVFPIIIPKIGRRSGEKKLDMLS